MYNLPVSLSNHPIPSSGEAGGVVETTVPAPEPPPSTHSRPVAVPFTARIYPAEPSDVKPVPPFVVGITDPFQFPDTLPEKYALDADISAKENDT
jgi:hypothetical protein